MESFYQTLSHLGYTHPVHPTMVYLPIGCVMAAFIFWLTAMLFSRVNLMTSARHCINLASIAVIPTILFGYMDWQYFHGGNWIFPFKRKMILAALLVVLLSLAVVYQRKLGANRKSILALYTLCFFNVIALGYYGGEIVFAGFERKIETSATPVKVEKEQHDTTVTYAEVADIFHQNCILCHKGPGAPLGLQLDTYVHVMEGGLDGKVIIPGKPEKSELIHRIRGQSKPAMPYMQEPLPENKIEILTRWIQQGAINGDIRQ